MVQPGQSDNMLSGSGLDSLCFGHSVHSSVVAGFASFVCEDPGNAHIRVQQDCAWSLTILFDEEYDS